MFLHCLLVPQDWAVGNRKNGRGGERKGRGERKERRREEEHEEKDWRLFFLT